MIIRRIQAVEPRKERKEQQENRRRVDRSTCNDPSAHNAEIKIVPNEDHKDQESGLNQLRRIFPCSPRF
jgi:hypothetical protein